MTTEEKSEFHEHLKIRVPAVQEAIKRTRFAFLLCTLASFASLICLWNSYMSMYRFLAEKPLPVLCKDRPTCSLTDSDSDRERELLIDSYKTWVESQAININLLGIRIGVSDFAIMDSLAMYIFLYYSLLTIRRENREVGLLLKDISGELDYIGYAAYSAVNSFMVFNLNRSDDNAISTLKDTKKREATIPLIRRVSDVLLWAPTVTILFIVFSDLLSLVSESPYPFSSVFRHLPIMKDSAVTQMVEICCMELFALSMAVFSVIATRQVRVYGAATRDVLDEFAGLLHARGFLARNIGES